MFVYIITHANDELVNGMRSVSMCVVSALELNICVCGSGHCNADTVHIGLHSFV